MAHPPLSSWLLLLAAAAGLFAPSEVVAEPGEEARALCPEGLWPLPAKVSPRVTYSRSPPLANEDVGFLYHPCAHPWLKLQLAALAHASAAQPSLAPDSSLSPDRPLMLAAWGVALELAWVEPDWVAHWLKRWRWWRKQRKKAWSHSDSLPMPPPSPSAPGRGRPCQRGCVQAPALAFALRSWRPPGTAVAPEGLGKLFPSGVRTRRLRAVLGLQSTPAAARVPSASPWSFHKQQALGAQGEGDNAPLVPTVPLLPGGPPGNASTQTETRGPKGKGGPGGCACPTQASLAPRAAAPPRAAPGPTPRTEEAAWAAMALSFLLVLLTLATLCTKLHRNFRRGESIYWGPTLDSQDTVAAVLKRRLLIPPRRVKRSRGRLLSSTMGSGPDGDSSD